MHIYESQLAYCPWSHMDSYVNVLLPFPYKINIQVTIDTDLFPISLINNAELSSNSANL